jgi:hypothetical protein
MTTSSLTAAPTQSTDAEFRTWCQAVHDSLAAVGMVQTSDTGQINLSTVTKPGAGSTVAGYEIWRFNDALQSSYPVYIRLEYGSGSSATNPRLGGRVGTATNGVGDLTVSGAYMNAVKNGYTSMTASTTARNIWASGDSGRLALIVWPGADTGTQSFTHFELYIERTKDNTGTATSDAVIVLVGHGQAQGNHFNFLLRHDTAGSVSNRSEAGGPMWNDSGVQNTDVYLFPIFVKGNVATKQKVYGPLSDLLLYYDSDIAKNTNVSVSHYGGAHTYKTLGDWSANWVYPTGGGTSQSASIMVAVRWE